MKTPPLTIDELCGKVYFDRLRPEDQSRVTAEQCRKRGTIYRPIVESALHHLGVELAKPETAEDLV